MTAIASPEFIALCQMQLKLLTQQLTRSSAALYIADVANDGAEQANFVPVVSYPEPLESWVVNFERASAAYSAAANAPNAGDNRKRAANLEARTEAQTEARTEARTEEQSATSNQTDTYQLALPEAPNANLPSTGQSTDYRADQSDGAIVTTSSPEAAFVWPEVLHPDQRFVMPLVYTDVVVGLLVAVRPDRAWNNSEREHIEAVGASLAGGCVLERRNQWLQGQLAHKRGLQSRQSEVFHNLLHQFRNPLTAVSTFGQLMVKRLGPEDPNAPIATGIVRENKRLRELVSHFDQAVALGDADIAADSITADSEIARPQIEPQPSLLPASDASGESISDPSTTHGLGQALVLSAQHLPDIVEPVLAVASIVAAEKGVTLKAQVAADTPSVWGEEEALGEVVTNLVDNAIKYSPAGATVWVQTGVSGELDIARVKGSYQGIVVGDTGPGIPAADLPRLFERNYRGVQAQGEIPGTGLGLAIAHSLIQEMHGTIEVISPAVGTPWLPTAAAHAQSEVKDAAAEGEDTQLSAQANIGAGTVFVVWLREVDLIP